MDLEPIIYLRGENRELQSKQGGGQARPPWVDIDSGPRDEMVSALASTRRLLTTLPLPVQALGVPLKIDLRTEALAKSNRPTEFLLGAGVAPVAAGAAGELFALAGEAELIRLASAIATASSKTDTYAVSTIEELSVYSPLESAFKLEGVGTLSEVLNAAREESELLRIDLFPWLHPSTPWGAESSFAEHL